MDWDELELLEQSLFFEIHLNAEPASLNILEHLIQDWCKKLQCIYFINNNNNKTISITITITTTTSIRVEDGKLAVKEQ